MTNILLAQLIRLKWNGIGSLPSTLQAVLNNDVAELTRETPRESPPGSAGGESSWGGD